MHRFLKQARVDADDDDVRLFFNRMVSTYLMDVGLQDSLQELYLWCGLSADYLEQHDKAMTLLSQLHDSIESIFARHLPVHKALSSGHGVEDCYMRGPTALVIELDPQVFECVPA